MILTSDEFDRKYLKLNRSRTRARVFKSDKDELMPNGLNWKGWWVEFQGQLYPAHTWQQAMNLACSYVRLYAAWW